MIGAPRSSTRAASAHSAIDDVAAILLQSAVKALGDFRRNVPSQTPVFLAFGTSRIEQLDAGRRTTIVCFLCFCVSVMPTVNSLSSGVCGGLFQRSMVWTVENDILFNEKESVDGSLLLEI